MSPVSQSQHIRSQARTRTLISTIAYTYVLEYIHIQ